MPVNTWYYKEVFSKIKKKNPGISCAGLMKIASKEFSLLPDKKKVKYIRGCHYNTACSHIRKTHILSHDLFTFSGILSGEIQERI